MDAESLAAIRSQVAANLLRARGSAGLTLKDVEERTGIGFGKVSEYERGKKQPNLDTIYRLASVYGVQPADLLPTIGHAAHE